MLKNIGVLLMAYGTPEREEDIEPYLKGIFKGRQVPDQVLKKVLKKYKRIGFSPLKEITLKQCALMQEGLKERGFNVNVSVGMKHWEPGIKTAVESLKKYGPDILIGIIAHPFSSIMGSGEYKEIFTENSRYLKSYFIDKWYCSDRLYEAWGEKINETAKSFAGKGFYTVFTSHGLPSSVEDAEYKKELAEFSSKLAEKIGIKEFCLAYQNGNHNDWYKPEVAEKLAELKGRGVKNVLLVPIGYISDSLETLYDMDVEYAEKAMSLGMVLRRAGCPNDSGQLIDAMSEAVLDKLNELDGV